MRRIRNIVYIEKLTYLVTNGQQQDSHVGPEVIVYSLAVEYLEEKLKQF